MKSPFPGMDPYVERFWGEMHNALITYLRDELNAALPPRYRALMGDRVFVAEVDEPMPGDRYPDVAVVDWPAVRGRQAPAASRSLRLLVQSPPLLNYAGEPLQESYVDIVDSKFGERVITSVEVLSPSNKQPGDGRTQFMRKQQEYRAGRISRVEIDLLRTGRRTFEFPERLLSAEQRKPYYITVHRGHLDRQAEIYAIDLREPLPVIGFPLRQADPDVPVDIQAVFDRAFVNARLPIDYDDPCDPPLADEDAAWATDLLRADRHG